MLDIVGARFHCAVCDSVDICSNCESAGLPGNLTSPDGGHDSSHIMIKVTLFNSSPAQKMLTWRRYHIRSHPQRWRQRVDGPSPYGMVVIGPNSRVCVGALVHKIPLMRELWWDHELLMVVNTRDMEAIALNTIFRVVIVK